MTTLVNMHQSVTANVGMDVIAFDSFVADGVFDLEIDAALSAGSVGVRVNAEVTDRVVLTVADGKATVDVTDLATGRHTFHLVALASPSTLELLYIRALGGD